MRIRPIGWIGIAVLYSLCGVTFSSPPPLTDGSHGFTDPSSLLTLHDSSDPVVVWAKYERYLLAKSRVTPLLLHFTPASACYNEIDDEEDLENDQREEVKATEILSAAQKACMHHENLVGAAVKLATKTLVASQISVIHVDVHVWPAMLDYHLVSSTPSLLWIPGRASGHFQRYPHVDTNFLNLNASAPLFSDTLGDFIAAVDKYPEQKNQDAETVTKAVAATIAAFVLQCQERSGYIIRDARGSLVPATPVSSDDDAFSGLDMVPVVAFLAFVVFVIYENQAYILKVMQMRFFWFVLCSGIVYIALSGLFHSVIHRRPWYYYGQMHGFVFVYPSSRQHFVLEGLVNGTWSFWLSLGAMSISDVFPTLRSRLAREDLIRWSLLLVTVSYMALNLTFLIKYRWIMM
uniref:Uncharacterized protein n=1 Tax=Peronospora matthiolae TaxID=2874970 RepID=A0AAV1UAF8_9STRA